MMSRQVNKGRIKTPHTRTSEIMTLTGREALLLLLLVTLYLMDGVRISDPVKNLSSLLEETTIP